MGATQHGLNPIQLHLLRLFAKEMTNKELEEVKTLLMEYYDQKVSEEVDAIWEKRDMSAETMEELLNKHIRSPYRESAD
ncbi:MAG: hypothetical protein SFU99_22030 [Saprospiraceae bacterium]|nr:hypothetical protein [Saprospiraceae bacterium]